MVLLYGVVRIVCCCMVLVCVLLYVDLEFLYGVFVGWSCVLCLVFVCMVFLLPVCLKIVFVWCFLYGVF